ncbi:hypothetical protein F8M41_022650 [Gigaspora margarita]|uniref:Uncharacterized protein n=1 Tax=Gigaspora margarita TaxID=4874 RepID=A0A8H4EI15_GIGMA|nr:hypothetical protein F8M41_022650 [Gigaspora margarita]
MFLVKPIDFTKLLELVGELSHGSFDKLSCGVFSIFEEFFCGLFSFFGIFGELSCRLSSSFRHLINELSCGFSSGLLGEIREKFTRKFINCFLVDFCWTFSIFLEEFSCGLSFSSSMNFL